MRTTSWISSLLFIFCNVTTALKSSKHCFGGCELTLDYTNFNDTAPGLSKKIKTCQSVLHATSLYLCFTEYCTEKGRDAWLTESNDNCRRATNETLPSWNIISNWTAEDVARVRRFRADEAMWNSEHGLLNEPLIPDTSFFERAFRTLDYAWFEIDIHRAYGIAMYYFWCIVISISICTRLLSLMRNIRHNKWQPVPDDDFSIRNPSYSNASSIWSLPYAFMKRHLLAPATFTYHCSQPIGWCTIPPRIQSLTIFLFVALNLVLCCISYPVFDGNIYWPLISTQLWRYISDRTGVIALANFPILWLFGMRNDVLMWATGWGFGTYNVFHRWVARVATVQAIVHSIGYTEMIWENGGWSLFLKYWTKHYFWNGELATISMCAILAFSVYGLRRSHYEIFLITHILFSVIVLLTTFYHVEIFNGEWNVFIYPCLAVWLLDRLLRALRILAFNWNPFNTRATATYDSASNLIRLEVPCARSLLKPQPGSYYYIYVLDELLYMHQNHPFTLAYISSNTEESDTDTPLFGPTTSQNRPFTHRTPSTDSHESDSLLPSTSASPPSLIFLIRPYDGFTSRLQKLASSTTSPHGHSVRVLLEGPYGSPAQLHGFHTTLFIVGGTGIAVPLSYLKSLLAEPLTSRTIHIVWAVRNHSSVTDVAEHDLKRYVSDGRFRLTVHVTQDEEMKDDISHEYGSVGIRDSERITLKAGRPDVDVAVREAAEEVGTSGRLAVVACGPAQMADDARRACVSALGRGYRGIEYFEESFKW